jgi:hypothetical protein
MHRDREQSKVFPSLSLPIKEQKQAAAASASFQTPGLCYVGWHAVRPDGPEHSAHLGRGGGRARNVRPHMMYHARENSTNKKVHLQKCRAKIAEMVAAKQIPQRQANSAKSERETEFR